MQNVEAAQLVPSYDFDSFVETRSPTRLRVVKRSQPRRRRKLSRKAKQTVKIVSLCVVFLSLVCSVLLAQLTVTELNGEIANQQKELTQVKSEYAYLTNELEMKTNLKVVEEQATARLGLVKLDPSQIVYIDRGRKSTIVYQESWLSKLLAGAGQSSMSFFMEYRRP